MTTLFIRHITRQASHEEILRVERAQSELIERLRRVLADQPSTREVAMFGGRSFMVNDKLAVSALKDGDLLARIPPERHEELTAHPGVAQAEMGDGRSMGPSWITVSRQSIDDDARLAFWVDVALGYGLTKAARREDA